MKLNSYRLDIDGLRAVAVLLVLGFHLNLELISGGHIGVDAFFVLSGFLITSILVEQISQNQFSIRQFYLRRIQRLFPALYTTVLLTFIAAAFILLPNNFEQFARSAVAAIFSLSNVLFWAESGYWDIASESKPLLHTWSLGVEEQFYLVWPVLLLVLIRLKLPVLRILTAITALGFLLSYFYSQLDLSGAFYLLPARVFQFSAGGMLALVPTIYFQRHLKSEALRSTLFVLGITILLVSAWALNDDILYPGAYSIIPTLGTLLIITAGSHQNGQGRWGKAFLEHQLLVWVGRISYSLYLVHWPIIVLYRHATGYEFTALELILLTDAIFTAAAMLHYGVEKRFYRHRFSARAKSANPNGSHNRSHKLTGATLAYGLLIVLISSHAWINSGWSWRFPNMIYSNEAINATFESRVSQYSADCQILQWPSQGKCKNSANATVLFFGNSHEPDGYNFMRAGYPAEMDTLNTVNFGTVNECSHLSRTASGWQSSNSSCQARLDQLFQDDFIHNLDLIVFSEHHTFKSWNENNLKIISDLKAQNKAIRVLVISDYLETHTPCVNILNDTGDITPCFADSNIAYNPDVARQELYPAYKHLFAFAINRMHFLCTNTETSSCLSSTQNGIPFSFDKHHNSLEFAQMSGRRYAQLNPTLFEDLLSDDFSPQVPLDLPGIQPSGFQFDNRAKIQGLYITIYGRAADWAGLEYWLQQLQEDKQTLLDISSVLSAPDQPEFTGLFSNLDSQQSAHQLYQNILNRAPDTLEQNVWQTGLNNGSLSLAELATKLLTARNRGSAAEHSTLNSDFMVVNNKIQAAMHFSEQTKGMSWDHDRLKVVARMAVQDVTAEVETVQQSKDFTDLFVSEKHATNVSKH